MSAIRWLVLFVIVGALLGCGLRVPPVADSGDRVEGEQLVHAILVNITCELRDAVSDLQAAYPQGTFLDGYGIETTLTLTYEEKGSLAPGVTWMPASPASAVFTLGSGLSLWSDATRKNVIDGYYLVKDLKNARCSEGARSNGAFLLQSDLKLSEWLFDVVSASVTNVVDFKAAATQKDFVLQHEVKFIIDTGFNATPSWKFTLVTVNPSGPFLGLDRTRTNDLLITLGPAAPAVIVTTKNGRKVQVVSEAPNRRAADLHLSATISNGIQNAVRSALQP